MDQPSRVRRALRNMGCLRTNSVGPFLARSKDVEKCRRPLKSLVKSFPARHNTRRPFLSSYRSPILREQYDVRDERTTNRSTLFPLRAAIVARSIYEIVNCYSRLPEDLDRCSPVFIDEFCDRRIDLSTTLLVRATTGRLSRAELATSVRNENRKRLIPVPRRGESR
jgi:hypothetical protein